MPDTLAQQVLAKLGMTGQAPANTPPALPGVAEFAGGQFPALIDQTQANIQQGLSGLADITNPAPAKGPAFNPSEKLAARVLAAINFESRMKNIAGFPDKVANVEGMAAGQPAPAAELGVAPGTATSTVMDMLAKGGKAGLSALDVAGTQIGRPGQALMKGLKAYAEGSQWDEAIKKGLIGSLEYGWHNDRYTRGADVLKAFGREPGYVSKHKGWLPEWTERDVEGFFLEVLADPITYVTYGAPKAAQLLGKLGKFLNPQGARILTTMEHAGALSESPVVRTFLQGRGRNDLIAAIERVAPEAKAAIASPMEITNATRANIRKVYDSLGDEVLAAAKEGKLTIPHPTEAGRTVPFRHLDPLLREQMADKLSDVITKDSKLMARLTDPDGLKLAGVDIPFTGYKTREAIKGAVSTAADATGNSVEALGKMLEDTGLPIARGLGRKIAVAPEMVSRVGTAVGKTFSTVYGLPPAFARHLKNNYFHKFRGMEYNIRQTAEGIFKGVAYDDKIGLTKAIDSRNLVAFLEDNPGLQKTVDGMHQSSKELLYSEIERKLLALDLFKKLTPKDKASLTNAIDAKKFREFIAANPAIASKLDSDNYVYHYYHNRRKVAEVLGTTGKLLPPAETLAPRYGIRSARTLDPSTYQRAFDTLAEAELHGLNPEYDIAKLFTMRQVNGWRAVVTHDFIESTANKFGLVPIGGITTADAARLGGLAAGEEVKVIPNMSERIRTGLVDVTDPARTSEIAQSLVAEGGTKLDILDRLPDDAKREFLRLRLGKAARGHKKEWDRTLAKYSPYKSHFPRGEAKDLLGDTFSLPKLDPKDGGYRSVQISNVGTTVLPARIVDKLLELQEAGIFNRSGSFLHELLRMYDKIILNPFRKYNTVIYPGFQFRNYYTNIVNSSLDIGIGVMNPVTRAQVVGMLRGTKGIVIKTKTGEVITGEQMLNDFIKYGGMNTLYKRANIYSSSGAMGVAEDVVRDISRWNAINPFAVMRGVGTRVENDARLTHFLALRKDGLSAPHAMERTLKFLFDYENLTNADKEIFRRAIPFWCVPDYSEILTRDGWKTCDSLQVGEDVLTYNTTTDTLEWQPCQEKSVFDYDGELVEFGTKRRKFVCTSDHKWMAIKKEVICARDYGKELHTYVYPETRGLLPFKDLTTNHWIVMAAKASGQSSILTPEQARLLGWLVTDGTWRWRGNHCEAGIYQSPKKFLDEVKSVAGGHCSKPHPQTGTVRVAVLKERVEPLKPYLDKSKLIAVVTRLSLAAADAMYDAMYKADGCTKPSDRTNGTNSHSFFCAQNQGVLEAFRALALMRGYKTTENSKGCYVSEQRMLRMGSGTSKPIPYSGRIWCPTTANGTWVMRQGTAITLTGNSWVKFNTALQAEMAVRKPRMLLNYSKLFKTLQADKNPEKVYLEKDLMPQYMRAEWGMQIGPGQEKQMSKYLLGVDLPFSDLNNFYSHDVQGTLDRFYSQTGPLGVLKDSVSALFGNENQLSKGIDQGSPAYWFFDSLKKGRIDFKNAPSIPLPGGPALADSLKVHIGFDKQGRKVVMADPARTKALLTIAVMDRPFREISRFVGPEDSNVAALARLFTGMRFVEINPEQLKRARIDASYRLANDYINAVE